MDNTESQCDGCGAEGQRLIFISGYSMCPKCHKEALADKKRCQS
jgi:hypothetical protein